jgi:hypothetical protein
MQSHDNTMTAKTPPTQRERLYPKVVRVSRVEIPSLSIIERRRLVLLCFEHPRDCVKPSGLAYLSAKPDIYISPPFIRDFE